MPETFDGSESCLQFLLMLARTEKVLTVKKRDLYNEAFKNKVFNKENVENYIFSRLIITEEDENFKPMLRHKIINFVDQLQTRLWKNCHRNKDRFESRYETWLDSDISFQIGHSQSLTPPAKRGRPQKKFEDLKIEAKRLRSCQLRAENSASLLLHAAGQKFREEGNEKCAKLLKVIGDDPSKSTEILNKLKYTKEEKPTKLSAEESLLTLIDADLSKSQYLQIRAKCSSHNANIFASYHEVGEAKEEVYPDMVVTESSAEVSLQSLLDKDAERLIKFLAQDKAIFEKVPENSKLIFHYKWGIDGSGNHTNYQQRFSDSSISADHSMLLTAASPLVLKVCDPASSILWSNPCHSSVRFCKPIHLQLKKENKEVVIEERDYILGQIKSLKSKKIVIAGKELEIIYELHMTMIDGKTRAFLTNATSFAACCICKATPSTMSNSSKFTVTASAFKYGLSTLHARIRFLECILNISYRLEIKKWAAGPAKIAERKRLVQKNILEEIGILVDVVKQQAGNTNCGNTSRRFFADPGKASKATGVDEDLITRFATILDALSSGQDIDVHRFREYASATIALYESLYSWYYMPSSVHMVLAHGADILAAMELPIGLFSEEALEARNKNIRSFREHRTRKCSAKATMEDLLRRLLISSDLYLSSLHWHEQKPKKSQSFEKFSFLLKM